MKRLRWWQEIPHFADEDEEHEFWKVHDCSDLFAVPSWLRDVALFVQRLRRKVFRWLTL